jgi:hypothetical protein
MGYFVSIVNLGKGSAKVVNDMSQVIIFKAVG